MNEPRDRRHFTVPCRGLIHVSVVREAPPLEILDPEREWTIEDFGDVASLPTAEEENVEIIHHMDAADTVTMIHSQCVVQLALAVIVSMPQIVDALRPKT